MSCVSLAADNGVAANSQSSLSGTTLGGGPVDSDLSFKLQLKDRFNNDITSTDLTCDDFVFTIALPATTATPSCAAGASATFDLSWKSTVAGSWSIAVTATTGELSLSHTAVLTPLALDASVSTYSAGIAPMAGDSGNLDIYAKDRFGNAKTAAGASFEATVTGFTPLDGGDNVVPTLSLGAWSFNDGGRYAATYTATRSGVYSVTVTESGSTVGSGPFELKVEPNRFWAPAMGAKISGAGATAASAGHEASFNVVGVDKYGNVYSKGAVEFTAAITADDTGVSIDSTRSEGTGTGWSRCSYTTTATGMYSVAITLTDIGQFDNAGGSKPSVFKVTGTAEEQRTTSSIHFVSSTVAIDATAGVKQVVVMQERDEFGNLRTISADQFTVSLTGPYAYPVNVTDVAGGKYDLSLAPTISGTYSIVIRAGSASGQQLTTDSFSMVVQPAAPHHTATILEAYPSSDFNQDSQGAVLPANNKFAIKSIDRYGNYLSVGGMTGNFGYGASLSVVLTSCQVPNVKCHSDYPSQAGNKVISPTVSFLGNGYYGVEYSTTVSGYYSLGIKYDNSYIVNSPSEMFVAAGTTVAGSSYAADQSTTCSKVTVNSELNGVVACTVASGSVKSTFGVRLVDQYGNTRYSYSNNDVTKFSTNSAGTIFNEYYDGSELAVATSQNGIQQEDGLQQIHFIATLSGRYSTTIDHYAKAANGSQSLTGAIKDSPAYVFVQPAEPYADHSFSAGAGLTVATAGIQASFLVTTRDIFMNTRRDVVSAVGEESGWTVDVKRTVEMTQPAGYVKLGTVTGQTDGRLLSQYSATKAGEYTNYVKLQGQSLSGSPHDMVLHPNIPAGPSYVTREHPSYSLPDKVFQGRVAIQPVTVSIRSVDQYGNMNTRGNYAGYNSTITKLPHTTIDHVDFNNGSYVLRYHVTQSGKYTVDISVHGETIVGSPVMMDVISGPTVPESTYVWAPTTIATAGINFEFPLLARDEYHNVRETGGDDYLITCSNGGDQILTGIAFDYDNGSYTGICYITKSGTYQVSVQIPDYHTAEQKHVMGSPFNVQVYANVANPASSGAFGGGLTIASAGEWSTFKIFARDRFFNPNTGAAGGSNFNLQVKPSLGPGMTLAAVPACPSPYLGVTPEWGTITSMPEHVTSGPCLNGTSSSVDIGGGTFVISYMWTLTGSYALEVSILTKEGVSFLADSPFNMTLNPGPTDITKSRAVGDAYELATAGEVAKFLIRTKDRYGNERSSSEGNFIINLDGYSPLTTRYVPQVLDLNTGSFEVSYTATASGFYIIQIFNEEGMLENSPSNITVYPSTSEPTAFNTTGDGISFGKVGDDAPIYQQAIVQAKDRFYNMKSKGGDEFQAQLSGGWSVAPDGKTSDIRSVPADVTYQGDGKYKLKYDTTKSGSFQFDVKVRHPLSGLFLHVQGSPFTVAVSTGAISEISPFISVETGEIVLLTTPGALNVATAGHLNYFLVVAKDKYENPRTEGGGLDLFDMKLVWRGKWGEVGKERGPMNLTIQCPITYVGDKLLPGDDPRIPRFPGQYRVKYPATVSGLYRLVASFDSKPMVGHDLGLEPDVMTPGTSSASFPLFDANGVMLPRYSTAGVRSSFTLYARDKYTNRLTRGGAKVDVNITGAAPMFTGNVTDAQTAAALKAPMHPDDRNLEAENRDFGIERMRVACGKACIVDNDDGTYHVYINPTISGQYQVDVTMDSSRVCQSGCQDALKNPYQFTTVANKMYPPLSIASGEGLAVATAGQEASFVIQVKDVFGNSRSHGRYTGRLGMYGGEIFSSYVKVNGVLLTPEECTCAHGVCTGCEAVNCKPEPGQLEVPECSKQMQGYPKVQDNLDGTYKVIYKATRSSNYTVMVTVDNLAISGCPFEPWIKPHVTDPRTCLALGAALYRTDAGDTRVVEIQAKDQYGNVKSRGGDQVSVNIIHRDYPNHCQRTDSLSTECIRCGHRDPGCSLFDLYEGQRKPLNLYNNVSDHGDGIYSIKYIATVSGIYKFHIRMIDPVKGEFLDIGQKTIYRSPFPLTCIPGMLDPRSSVITGEGSELATVLDEAYFLLWPRDRFGNILVGGADSGMVQLCGVGTDCSPKSGVTFVKLSFFNFDNNQLYQVQEKYSRGIVKLQSGNAIKAVARPGDDGSTAISYTMIDTGRYRVNLKVTDLKSNQDVEIQGSPFNMTVYPNDPDPDPKKCSVEMVDRIKAGVRGEGIVYLRNQYGILLKKTAKQNMIDIVEIMGNPSQLDFRYMNRRDGSFLVNFSPTRSGTYSFSVRATDKDGAFVDVYGSPTTTVIAPADTDPKNCLAFVTSIERVIAGSVLSYTIQSRDKYGNDADPNALRNFDMYASYMVLSTDESQSRKQALITMPAATRYIATYKDAEGESTVTRSGQYKLITTNLEVNVVNSPYIFNVIAGKLDPAVATVDSSSVDTCTAGIFAAVRIQSKDTFGNELTGGGDEGFVLIRNESFSPQGSFSYQTRYLIEGKTDASFSAEIVGKYKIHVFQSGIQLIGSPFYSEVLPAIANALESYNSTRVPEHGVAGVKLSFMIQAVDAFGNLHFTGGENFDVILKGLAYLRTYIGDRLCVEVTTDVTTCVQIADQENGRYLVEYTPTTSGDYNMDASLISADGTRTQIGEPGTSSASPWMQCVPCINALFPGRACEKCRSLGVDPAEVNVDTSTILGRSSEMFSAGEEEEFFIYARDEFGNIQTDGGLQIAASVKPIQGFDEISTTVQDLCEEDLTKCGQYTVTYMGTQSGLYMLSVSIGGQATSNPQLLRGYPAPKADPLQSGLPYMAYDGILCKDICEGERCCLLGERVSFGNTGSDMTFEIVARDRFGNDMTQGGETFTMDVSGPMMVAGMIDDLGTGKYIAKYKVLLKGVYVVAIRLRGIHVGKMQDVCDSEGKQCFAGSPAFGLQITDPGTGLEGLVFRGDLPPATAVAGRQGIFYVDASDETAKKKLENMPLKVTMLPAKGRAYNEGVRLKSLPVRFNESTDEYKVPYNENLVGLWKISVTANGQIHCVGSPFSLVVRAADADPAKTIVTGTGNVETLIPTTATSIKMAAVKNKEIRFYIVPCDEYSNQRVDLNQDPDDVRWSRFEAGTSAVDAVRDFVDRESSGDHAGQYSASFTPTKSGKAAYNLMVYVANSPVYGGPGSSINVFDESSTASRHSVAYGSGLSGGVAGAVVTFTIYARDENGCQLSAGGDEVVVTIFGETDQRTTIKDNNDGTYLSSHIFRSVGTYELEIQIGGLKIYQNGAIFECSITSDVPAPLMTKVEGKEPWMRMNGVESARTELWSDFQLLLKDQYGNRITEGIALHQISVSVSGPSYPAINIKNRYCTDHAKDTENGCARSPGAKWHDNDGSYLVSYATTAQGRYSVSVSVQNSPLDGSPFIREASPNDPSPDTTYANGNALSGGYAGVEGIFAMAVFDKFGNPFEGKITTNVTLESKFGDKELSVIGRAVQISGPDYEGYYQATIAGKYDLEVIVHGFQIRGSPFTLEIKPGDTHWSQCKASGPGTKTAVAGVPATFTIKARDKYGNDRTVGGDDFRTNLAGQQLASGTLTDYQNGTYMSSFFLTLAGEYTLTSSLGMDQFQAIYRLPCLAAPFNGQATELTNNKEQKRIPADMETGLCRTKRGDRWQGGPGCEFFFQARDEYGSEIKHCRDVPVILVASESTATGEQIAYNATPVDITTGETNCKEGYFTGSLAQYFGFPDPNTCNGPCNGNAGITRAGTYSVSIQVNGQSIFGSPFRTIVSAAETFPRACIATAVHFWIGAQAPQRSSTAGVPESFTIQSRDYYGNAVMYDPFKPLDVFEAVMQTQGLSCDEFGQPLDEGAVCVLATVRNNLDSTQTISYTPWSSGKYELNAVLVKTVQGKSNRMSISNSPFTSTVKPNVVSVENSMVFGENILWIQNGDHHLITMNSTADAFTSFNVFARDAFNNVNEESTINFGAYATRRGLVAGDLAAYRSDVAVMSNNDGSYEVSYTITTAGKYTLTIEYAGRQLRGSPFPLEIIPGAVDPSECTCEGGGFSGGMTGFPATYKIIARDSYGNQVTEGGAVFAIHIFTTKDLSLGGEVASIRPVAVDDKDGSYSVTYLSPETGRHRIMTYGVQNGIQVEVRDFINDNVIFMVDDGYSVPAQTYAYGAGIKGGRAGQDVLFITQIRNEIGLNRNQGGIQLSAKLSHLSSDLVLDVETLDANDGTYRSFYMTEMAGSYELVVKMSTDHIQGSPFTVAILPGETSARASMLHVSGSMVSIVSETVTFKILAKDKFYNEQQYDEFAGPDPFVARLVIDGGGYEFRADILNNQDGTYQASYVTTRAGAYTLFVTLNGETVDERDSVRVSPGDVVTENCLSGGSGLKNMEAGQLGYVSVTALDFYGNVVQSGFENFNVTLIKEGGEEAWLGYAQHCDDKCIARTTCPCSEINPGTYMMNFQVTTAANFKISVERSGNLLTNFPRDIKVSPTRVETTKVSVLGCESICTLCSGTSPCAPCDCPVVNKMQAGSTSTFTLESRDRFGNKVFSGGKAFRAVMMKAIPEGKTGCYVSDGCVPASVEGELNDNKDGTYQVKLIGTVPGLYTLNITRGAVPIFGSPMSVLMSPGTASSAPDGSWFALDPVATAGSVKTFTIQSRDQFGNVLSKGNEQFVTQLIGTSAAFRNMILSGSAEDNKDGTGTYFSYFMAERAGTYDTTVKLDAVNIYPGRWAITVFPAAVDPQKSSVTGTGLDELQSAGDVEVDSRYIAPEIRVVPRDRYGNVYSFDGLHIEAVSTGPQVIISRSTKDKKYSKFIGCGAGCGEYIIYNPLTISGSYSLDVRLHVDGVGQRLATTVFMLDSSSAASSKCTYDEADDSEARTCSTDKICTFEVQSVDFFGNEVKQRGDTFEAKLTYVTDEPVSTTFMGSSSELKNAEDIVIPGKYLISYSVTVSGQYVMQVSRYGFAIANSPSYVTINAGVPVASSCTTTPILENDGTGMIGGKKFETVSFTIYARDRYGNVARTPSIYERLAVDITAPDADGSKVESFRQTLSGGRYSVRYIPKMAGLHTMLIKVDGQHISGSPYSVQIEDDAGNIPDEKFCTIHDGAYMMSTVNSIKRIPLAIKNNVGDDLDFTQGARFHARLENVECGSCSENPVVENPSIDFACCIDHPQQASDGPPMITYYSMKAGLAKLYVQKRTGLEELDPPILNSPFEVQISPGVTDAPSSVLTYGGSVVTGDVAIQATAGMSNKYIIVANDAYGNQQMFKQGAASGISIAMSGPSEVTPSLLDGADGTFSMFYGVTRAGTYSLSVKIEGTPIRGSPFNVSVQADNLFVRASTSSFSVWEYASSGQHIGKFVGLAGVPNVALVQSRDAFGNVYPGTRSSFSMSMTLGITSTRTLKPKDPETESGVYAAYWDLKKAGTYFGAIFGVLDGCTSATTCANVRGSPFTVEILPDIIDAQKCRVYGAGSTYSRANSNAVLFIIARDRFENDVVSEDSMNYFEMTLTTTASKRNGFYQRDQQGAKTIKFEAQSDSVSAAGIKMIYKAVMPGRYQIDVHYNKTQIGGTSGVSCGPDKPCPEVGKATSPITLQAQFSDSGGHIYVDFDQQTNKANVTGAFSCDVLFADQTVALLAAVPTDATCRFLSATQLDVVLGFGATVLVNDDLTWRPDVLRRRPVCSSKDVCFDYSFSLEGKVRVKRPRNPVSPTAILKAPASVGPCDSVTLDASASYGSAGRQLQYLFGLEPGTKNDKVVRNFILGKVVRPYELNAIEIPKHLLMVGESYQFVVKVSNFLDAAHTDIITVTKVADSGPAVFIEGPNTVDVRSSQPFKLRGSATLSACNEGSEDIEWAWSVTSTSAPSSMLPTLNEKTKDTRNLYVPENSLVPGHSYSFILTGKMAANVSNFGAATVVVNCVFAPVLAQVSGGDKGISMNEDLLLDAGGSLDLDGAHAVGGFNYKWTCQNAAGQECFNDVDGLLLRDTSKLELARGTLVPGVYTFGVSVSKEPGPRTAFTSVTVYVMPTAQMTVTILPLSTAKINSNERLVLNGQFETGCGASQLPDLLWSQSAGDDVLQYPSTMSTPGTLKGLALKPNVLVPGATYRFRLTARCPKSSIGPITAPIGFGEINVKVNVAPSSGQFQVTPTVGKGTEDKFTLTMLNWVDDPEDLPFKYEFRYATQASPTDQVPLGTVDTNYIEASLPGPGKNPAASHKVTLIAFVVDQYAASTKSEFIVTVTRANSTGSALDMSALDQHVATGNVEGIIQLAISLSNEEGLTCSAKEGMISKLKSAAAKVEMNKAEVAGFSYAVKSAMAGDCVSSSGRRLLADAATDDALELTGSLVGNSMGAGLDPTAERGMADTLSSSLGSISSKNKARRSLRRLLSMDMYMQHGVPATPPFFRGKEGRDLVLPRRISEGQYHLLAEASGPKQKSGDMLMGARDSLMSSQLNGALTGEDAKGVDSEKIAMKAQQRNPEELAGASLGTGSSKFATPPSMFKPGTGGDMTAKASNLADSPFDSDNEVGNVAGLSMGVKVANLSDPIALEMPSQASAKSAGLGPPIQYKCVDVNGKLSALTFTAFNDCVATCVNKTGGSCIEISNDACQKDEWDSCVDGEVDTCRFWNSDLNDWDGEGCIVEGSVANGGVMCHCYHLTDFGGAGNDVMPKMNVPDPTNPGAAFKNLGADKILVIVILCLFLLMYWGLFYWGWRQDRIDNERMESMDGQDTLSKAQERAVRNSEQEEALVQGNNFRMLQKAMNGKLSKGILMIRNKAVKLFKGQHKLFSAFYCKRHHYTRPRRFTVLFIMLIGNMMVNGFFCGNEKSSMVAKIIMGLIASLIMVPATLFFKFIFMTLDVDPKTRERWNREDEQKAARRKQEMAMTMTTGPTVDGISAPPPHLRGVVPPRKIARGYVPEPDHARMGVSSRMNTFATKFKRRWTTTGADAALADPQDEGDKAGSRPFTPVSVGHESSQRSVDSRSSGSGEYERQQEVGAYLPRRALPMRSNPRPPAPSVVSSRDDASSVTPIPLHLTREMEDGPDEQRESMRKHEIHSKKEQRKLAGKAKFEAAVAKKLVAAISKPVDEKKEKRKKLIDHRFQYMAYGLATMFYGICFYFCLLLGVTFSKEIERAWLMAFFLAIFQDLFITETMVLSTATSVKMVIIPNLASVISGSIAKKYM